MRKILLATTALLAFAGAAQAAESPIQVTLGGYVDFRAAMFNYSEAFTGDTIRHGDMNTEYRLTVAADGKAAGGIEYGAKVSLDNDQTIAVDNNTLNLEQAYVYLSANWGKVVLGDHHGASDLFVYAPTVGASQVDGDWTDFVGGLSGIAGMPGYTSLTEDATKVSYMTPKVGNAKHKVQMGISYTPEEGDRSVSIITDKNTTEYKNNFEVSAQYTGSFDAVNVVVTPMVATADYATAASTRDYTLWGIGAQAMYAGFTFGGSYVDAGDRGTVATEDKTQRVWTLGLGYEFDKVAVAANYIKGKGYANVDGAAGNEYVKNSSAIGLGAVYNWFPGMTTNADAVFFSEKSDAPSTNKGHVLMLSQKMAF